MKFLVEQIAPQEEEEVRVRCSKSMILNTDKIACVCLSVSGRFEATLVNQEKVIISRQYVGELKRMLEI